jgi:dihydrofolate reductase
MHINGIVAMCKNRGIGLDNKLPWHLPEDLKRFQKFTMSKGSNAIIMGRNTWEGISFLNNRDHLILSTTVCIDYVKNRNVVRTFSSINSIIKYCEERKYDNIWVIGGTCVYKQFMEANLLDTIYMTYIDTEYNCDTYFPSIPENYFVFQKKIMNEMTNNEKHTYMIVFKQVKPGMKLIYDRNECTLQKIHYEDSPTLYFTIQTLDGREKQTIKDKLLIK